MLHSNRLSGSIPSTIGKLLQLELLELDRNHFSGSIPEETQYLENLRELHLAENKFSGTVPDVFVNMSSLDCLDLSLNHLRGPIPISMWAQNSIRALYLKGNEISGVVPDHFCDQLNNTGSGKMIEVDKSRFFLPQPKVECQCCDIDTNFCHRPWDITEHTIKIPCLKKNLFHLEYYRFYRIHYSLMDGTLFMDGGEETEFLNDANICLSPTACYDVEYSTDKSLNGIEYHNMSYSVSEKMFIEHDECISVNVCGTIISQDHPRRLGLDHLTQSVDIDMTMLQNPISPKEKALCWIITKDEKYDEQRICDGRLLQRYVLAVLTYYSEELSNMLEELASQETCDWPIVECYKDERFVEHLNATNRNLKGEFFHAVGFISSIRTIHLGQNLLHGEINEAFFDRLPNLEVFDVGDNNLGGIFPKGSFTLPKLRELNISSNKFVGSFPDDIKYSDSIGK